jgi:hypothetical protein
VTLVSAAIGNAPGTPSEAFLPVLRNGVTTEYHHVQALKQAGGKPLTTKYWFPDAALDNGGIGVFGHRNHSSRVMRILSRASRFCHTCLNG